MVGRIGSRVPPQRVETNEPVEGAVQPARVPTRGRSGRPEDAAPVDAVGGPAPAPRAEANLPVDAVVLPAPAPTTPPDDFGDARLPRAEAPRPSAPPPPPASVPQRDDMKPFPSGAPSTYVQPLLDPKKPAFQPSREQMVETILSVAPPAQQAALRATLEGKDQGEGAKSAGVTDESLQQAFERVLAARAQPGATTVSLNLTQQRTSEMAEGGDAGGTVLTTELGKTLTFTFSLTADAKGAVNGKPLAVDELSRLQTELKKVSPDLKVEALKDAGVSAEFIAAASPEQRDLALAQLRQATLTPGTKTVQVSVDVTIPGGDSGTDSTQRLTSSVTLKVDEKGNVNGKPLFIETAFATTRQFEALPTAEKKAMLERVGFKAEDLKPLAPDRATDILTKIAFATRTPGERSLEVDTGPDKFAIALKVNAQGDIEGSGVTKLPPPPKKNTFQKLLGPVLSVASILFPPIAPVVRVVQAGLAIANGARGLSLVGAVLGGAAGVANLAGSSLATGLSTAASIVNNVNGAIGAVRSGNILGAFSSVISLASTAGNLSSGGNFVPENLQQLGRTAGLISQVRSGDLAGAATGLFGEVVEAARRGQDPLQAVLRNYGLGSPGDGVAGGGAPNAEIKIPGSLAPLDPVDLDALRFEDFGDLKITSQDVARSPDAVTVGRGDTLSGLAQKYLGDARKWPLLYEANKDVLGNPNALAVGQELKIPGEGFSISRDRENQLFDQAVITRPTAGRDAPPIYGTAEDGTPITQEQALNGPRATTPATQTERQQLVQLAEAIKGYKDIAAVGSFGGEALQKFVEGLKDAERTGNLGPLKELLKETPTVIDDLKQFAKSPLGANFKSLNAILDLGGAALTAVKAGADETNATGAGRAANVAASAIIDVVVGRSNPVVGVVDSFLSVIGADKIAVSTNLAGGAQSFIAILESLSPGQKADVLEAVRRKNAEGGNGLFIQIAANLGEELATKITNTLDKYSKDPEVIAFRAAQERIRNRARIIQQGG